MELRHLRHFLKVAEVGSITQAAQALNLSQPSLSSSIKTLEQSLGVSLFQRGGAGVALTRFGTQLKASATHILRETEKARDEIEALKGSGDALLSIGVMTAFSLGFFARLLARFAARQGDVCVESHSFTTNEATMIDKLRDAQWDLILTLIPGDFKTRPDIEVIEVGTSHSAVYCGAHHPLARKTRATAHDLAAHNWAVTAIGSADQLLYDCFSNINQPVNIRARTNSVNQITSLIQTTDMLCLAPDVSVAEEVSRGTIVQVDQSVLEARSTIALLYSNLSIRTQAMREFIGICTQEANSSARLKKG